MRKRAETKGKECWKKDRTEGCGAPQSEDQKKRSSPNVEFFFPQFQVKTKKKVFTKNGTLFFPKFRCRPKQKRSSPKISPNSSAGQRSYAYQSQIIGGIQSNHWGDLFLSSPSGFGTFVFHYLPE